MPLLLKKKKKNGHVIADCRVLKKKQVAAKPIAFVQCIEKRPIAQPVEKLAGSLSFLTNGFVSLSSDTKGKTPIKI